MFPLSIFPENSLAQSVITTVWVGVFVVSFFNLRFGWPFSGIVVPGYLVPLMISKPTAAAVVCLEGFLTYFIVRYFCENYLHSGIWSSFFGRDRFFALIVVSLIVRLVLDGAVLPLVGEFINRRLNIGFDYRNHLSSFGLIIVALIANQFWKTGFIRGLTPFGSTIGMTYVIIRFVLMPYTNFNIGNLEYMYENISTSLVASPKAYIILLTCGFIASRLNLLYGWDFNGILIPSLLALEWYQPHKILTTFLEAFLILVVGIGLLKTPVFRQVTMEGARKLLLFFNISFAYKLLLGYIQEWTHADLVMTDLFGYGYLVPTLIAIKMHDKGAPLRLTRATLQASLTGAAIASVLGFLLTLVPMPRGQAYTVDAAPGVQDRVEVRSISDLLRSDKLLLYQQRKKNSFVNPLPTEIESFKVALDRLKLFVRSRSPEILSSLRGRLASIGYEAIVVNDEYLYLRESGAPRGWGFYLVDLEQREGLTVEVPAPIEEWAVYEAGAVLFERLDARALAISGCSRRSKKDGSSDVLASGRTLYSVFHRIFAKRNVLQVRGYSDESLEELNAENVEDGWLPPERRCSLYVKGRIPTGLGRLHELIGPHESQWGRTRLRNLQRDETIGSFAELVLDRSQRKQLLALSVVREADRRNRLRFEDAPLRSWLLELRATICEAGSNRYRQPLQEELLYFDEEVVVPVLQFVRREAIEPELSKDDLAELSVISHSASVLDYELILLGEEDDDEKFLVVKELEDFEDSRCWGTYVFRLRDAMPYAVEIPRPLLEQNSFEYGIHLFDRMNAGYLLVAGSHPRANIDGSSDVVSAGNKNNLFCLVQQVVQRESEGSSLLVTQVRGLGRRPEGEEIDADLLLSMANGCSRRACLTGPARLLLEQLEGDGLEVLVTAGQERTAGYEAGGSRLAHYSRLMEEQEFSILWISPEVRRSFAQSRWSRLEADKFTDAGIASDVGDLFEVLRRVCRGRGPAQCPDDVCRLVEIYVQTRDVLVLDRLDRHPEISRILRVADVHTNQAFLLVFPEANGWPTVFNLSRYRVAGETKVIVDRLSRTDIDQFVHSRRSRLVLEETP